MWEGVVQQRRWRLSRNRHGSRPYTPTRMDRVCRVRYVDAAITVEGAAKRYGAVDALSGIDLAVERGTIVGLVGPNGAGKTTLIRILVGALRADAGVVRVLDRDPFRERREVRADIGYMPQAPVLYQDLTVPENVAFFARGHMARVGDAVTSVLDFVDLGDAFDRSVQTLSGGQQQRASLAAALVHDPNVLFLDEPTAGVDPQLRHAFWSRFRQLARSGVTLVVSTHQMDEVVHCDRVAIILSGRVLADATPAELFASGGATVRITTGDGTRERRVASVSADLPRLLRDLGLDAQVTGIDVEAPTLEEIILDLLDRERRADR
jgi:ABC-2 type transport system ATP-binding protein